jgi:hypothetical protein
MARRRVRVAASKEELNRSEEPRMRASRRLVLSAISAILGGLGTGCSDDTAPPPEQAQTGTVIRSAGTTAGSGARPAAMDAADMRARTSSAGAPANATGSSASAGAPASANGGSSASAGAPAGMPQAGVSGSAGRPGPAPDAGGAQPDDETAPDAAVPDAGFDDGEEEEEEDG